MDGLQSVELFLTWLANGLLVVLFWTLELERLFPLLTLPAVYLLVTQASREQRPFGLASACLAVLAAVVVPLPIPGIVAVMAWAGLIGVALDRYTPGTLRWRVIGGLALYGLAGLGWAIYSAYVATLSAEQWANTLATGEAASTIAQGRSFLQTISVWGLWIIMPLGYLVLLVEGIFIHPPMPAAPADLIHTVRGRPDETEPQEPGLSAPTWWPWRGGQ